MTGNRKWRAACLLLPLLYACPSELGASFEDIGIGARATGLGGAFSPLADDVHALAYNPAGLVYLKRKEFSATYGLIHPGLDGDSKITHSYVAYGQPVNERIGSFGLAWRDLSAQGLYSERVVTLGYGRRLSNQWAAGSNVKVLYRQFDLPAGRTDSQAVTDPSQTDPLFSGGNSRMTAALDLGVLWRPYRNYSLGLALHNFNEPNLAIGDGNRDPLSMAVKTGVAYHERGLTLLGEVDSKKFANGRDLRFLAAAEKWWQPSGFSQGKAAARGSLGFGSRNFSQFTAGFSYRWNAVQLDYGFLIHMGGITLGRTQGDHRLTLTLRFGRTLAAADGAYLDRAAELALRQAEKDLENARLEAERLTLELEKLHLDAEKRKLDVEKGKHGAAARAALKEGYSSTMDQYWRRKAQGAPVGDRIAILSQILNAYSGSGADVSAAAGEMAATRVERAKQEQELSVAWNFYQKLAARGMSVPERIRLVSQMIERFARSGVQIEALREELKLLKER